MNTGKQIGIFIVDDNKVFALALKADIESTFFDMPIKVHIFETGETCMLKFKEVNPHVVILDYQLNSKYTDAADGIKVLDWLKTENNDISVIMLTNNDHVDIALESFKHGAFDYVVKTDTRFKKINYSLLNAFNMMMARNDLKRYKRLLMATFVCVAVLLGGVTAIQFFAPSFFLK